MISINLKLCHWYHAQTDMGDNIIEQNYAIKVQSTYKELIYKIEGGINNSVSLRVFLHG